MTTILPPIVPAPFKHDCAGKHYDFEDGLSRFPLQKNSSSTLRKVRTPSSPISTVSVTSRILSPTATNDENHLRPCGTTTEASSKTSGNKFKIVSTRSSCPFGVEDVTHGNDSEDHERSCGRLVRGPTWADAGTEDPFPRRPSRSQRLLRTVQSSKRGVPKFHSRSIQTQVYKASPTLPTRSQVVFDPPSSPLGPPKLSSGAKLITPRNRGWATHTAYASLYFQSNPSPSTLPTLQYGRERRSDASSGFVHTVKTASLTNASFSVFSRSSRMCRSSDTQGHGAYARFSVESERPATNASLDEASIWRAIKRKQVLEELITTEEGYLSDLKALSYLYSTLLASVSCVPNLVRNSVRRNINDLLHLHEEFVRKLHLAEFAAASRKWADTVSPKKLARRHMRRQSLEAPGILHPTPEHRRTKSSFESVEKKLSNPRLRTAEPTEVADVAQIFKDLMPRFFSYEEYCAKHEIITQDLYRHASRWGAFEAGIEALAKSVRTLNSKAEDDKKALTVQDLLVKPIQRVCKYPLLLAELLRNTPVVDCPTAHGDVEIALMQLRDIVKRVNIATDNPTARRQIQKRWLLYERLIFSDNVITASQFCCLGTTDLCGVLHAAYQTKHRIEGGYVLSLLCGPYFILAVPAGMTTKFLIVVLIRLSDLRVESPSDGRGYPGPFLFFRPDQLILCYRSPVSFRSVYLENII